MPNNYIQGNVVMGVKDLPNIANYIDLHVQPVRKLHITVEVIDENGETIETIQGLATGGSLNISNSSLIRRTGNLSFVLFDYLLPKKDSLLWMTNKMRVYAGLENLGTSDGTITHFCLGTFYVAEPQVNISRDSRTIQIELQDNMMRWEQEQLENKLKIDAGTPLNTAIIQLMNFYGEYNVDVEFTDLKIPYTLEFDVGETILDVLQKLRDLYMDWECFYDIDGTLVFRHMDIQKPDGEPVAWVFDGEGDLATIYNKSFTYKNVKNRVVVVGAMDTVTGLTPKAEANITKEDSPFHSNVIGVRTKVINDSSLGTTEQCQSRARYELFKASSFQEQLQIDTIPIYYLDANNIIEIIDPYTKEVERYIVDSIQIGLGIEDEMSLSCHKLYYDMFDMDISLDRFREIADIVIDGITNKGWLSLSEARVSEYYGLEGDLSKLFVRFEYDGLYGVTAYTTGYFGDKNQTLTIDLADFENVSGENGDTGNGKGEYADRVLGHEMVHVIMNNAIGVEKTSAMPSWFKEGCAEFIHGADERLKKSIVVDNVLNDDAINNIISIGVNLMNGAVFQSDTDYYSASYVIIKYIDRNMVNGKDWKTLMASIKESSDTGDLAMKKAIAEHTGFATFEDFVNDYSANAKNYINTGIRLNIGSDEVDTGSIGGSDHRGTVDLNAEDIFNEALATAGVPAVNFVVEFDRP